MLYLTSIFVLAAIVAVINAIFVAPAYGMNGWLLVLYVAVSVVGVIAIDGVFATLVRWVLPKKFFGVDKKRFAAGRRECRFYEKIGIKRWKDKVLELGVFTAFSKKKIADPTNNEYVSRYIIEANYGIAVHAACSLFGFLVCLFFPRFWYSVGIPVAVVNMFYNNLSLHILRYNLPKLHTLYRINEKREKRKAVKDTSGDSSAESDDVKTA